MDIFAAAARVATTSNDIFDLLFTVESALPSIDSLNPSSVIDLERSYTERVANDGAGGMLQQKLRERFSTHYDEARGIVSLYLESPDKRAAAIFVDAIAGLSASDFQGAFEIAIGGTQSSAVGIAGPAAFSLGHLAYEAGTPALAEALSCLECYRAPNNPQSWALKIPHLPF